MRCAQCGEVTPSDPCASCGSSPYLEGRYRIDALIREGSFGAMLRATRRSDGAIVAIKEIPLRWSDAEKTRELIAREARVLQELSHPNIPTFIEHFTAGTGRSRAAYIVQEFIDGTDLQSDPRRRSVDEVLDLIEALLPTLAYLHGLSPPVIHRDIKPGNIIRAADGRLVLVDFGAVRDALRDSQLGGSTVAGTFGYMAPEQFMGDASPATDFYGLGATAVALLTRKDPQALLDAGQRLRWRQHASVSAPVADFIDALLAPEPGDRISTAQEARARLQAARRPAHSAPNAAPRLSREHGPRLAVAEARPSSFPEPELFEPPAKASRGQKMARIVVGLAAGVGLQAVAAVFVAAVVGWLMFSSTAELPVPSLTPSVSEQVAPVYEAAQSCSFDACRATTAQSLATNQTPMTSDDALALAQLCSFDECREAITADLYPSLAAPAPTTSDVRQLAETCSFDACREKVLINNYERVSDPERYLTLLDVFSFDNSRTLVQKKLRL